jgi:hypothetical protein
MDTACSTNGGRRRMHIGYLLEKPEGKRQLGRSRRRRMDNIEINLGEIGWCEMDWFDLAQDRYQWRALVDTVMDLRIP